MGLSGWANAPAKFVGTVGSASIFTDNIFCLIDLRLHCCMREHPDLTIVILDLYAIVALELSEVKFLDIMFLRIGCGFFDLAGLFWGAFLASIPRSSPAVIAAFCAEAFCANDSPL